MTDMLLEVYAVKYADRNNCKRLKSFILGPAHNQPHPMGYFVWVLKAGDRVIMVDAGYDHNEAKRRGRETLYKPVKAIEALALGAEDVDIIIITHLHYDHAGCLGDLPRAKIHIHPFEMAYATGSCMCEDALRMPFTGAHICDAVTALFSERVSSTAKEDVVVNGVIVHHIGGHSKGLQAARVKTAAGWMCLASDGAHFYENYLTRKPFPIVVDVEEMLRGFDRIQDLATRPEMVIPGHDSLVTSLYPAFGESGFVWRLDGGSTATLPDGTGG